MILNLITRPSWYLCGAAMVWGMISACTAAVHNPTGAILAIFFLGAAESVLYPGALYYISR